MGKDLSLKEMVRRGLCVLLLFPVFLAVPLARAQGTAGEIAGTVKDVSDAVLPGVALTITHLASGQERQLSTDSNGNYVAAALSVGEYTIRAVLPNFKTQIRAGIVLQVAERVRVDLVMELGEVTEQITVTESVPLMRTTNAEVSEVIQNQRIMELPLNGRQFVELTLLSDNVFLSPVGNRGAALAQTGRQVVVGGQRAGHNMYFLDGVSMTDQYFTNQVLSPSVDAIQEFKIQKSIYTAEFGGKSSASVSAATKAGSNTFHGSLYEFLRNDVFDARNFFDFDRSSPPPLRQNQFGGTLGGPIQQDKAFFFLNYEGLRERRALTRAFSLPSEKVRNGDLSHLLLLDEPIRITDPLTGEPFPDNKIPAGRLDPVARAFLEKVPFPNRPGEVQNFVSSPSFKNDQDQFTVRADRYLSQNDSVFARFTYANMRTFQPYGNTNLNQTLVPGFGTSIKTSTRSLALNETHIFSPTLIHEFRFGFLRVTGGQESENEGVDFAGQTAQRSPGVFYLPQIGTLR